MKFLERLTEKSVILTTLNICVMLLIFIADLQFTTEVYIGVLYLIVIMLSLWLPKVSYTYAFAFFSTILTIYGYFSSIYNVDIASYFNVTSFINLSMTLAAIWVTTIIAAHIKSMSNKLNTSETVHRAILEASLDPILTINKYGFIESASNAIEKTCGWTASELKGQPFDRLLAPEFKDKYNKLFINQASVIGSHLVGSTQPAIALHRIKREFPCELAINYTYIPELAKDLYTAVLSDVSIRKATEERMCWLSDHDELTKIYNRRYFNEQIQREWKRLLRSQEYLAIIMIDVDLFKSYNDYLGHQSGDSCLKSITANLELMLQRSTDFIARYGGEEFVVLLPSTDVEGAIKVANKLREQMHNIRLPHPCSRVNKYVTLSMGVAAMIPSLGCSYERLIRFADQALYKAKESGRDRFCVHEDNE